MAENEMVRSRRDQHLERLRKKYPEKRFEEDEEIFGQISDDYDQYEQENQTMRDREKTLSDMFRADPRSAYFLNDMREGKDPIMGLISRFGVEIKDVLDDPAMQNRIKEANQEYLDRIAKSRQFDEEYEKNMDLTLSQTLPQYQKNNNLTDEEIDTICAAWLQIVRDGVMGKITPETITLIANALNHDNDVANARDEGETAGKNAKIDMKLRKSQKGDGITSLNGRNSTPRKSNQSIFDLAREAD